MKGGVRAQMTDLFSKYETPVGVLVGAFMIVVIVFVGKVPVNIRRQADSFMGRALLLAFTALTAIVFGWPLGVLAAFMSATLIGAGSIQETAIHEGFSPDFNVRLVPTKHKWFVEKVMGENPLLIEEETVDTSAVQDLSEKYGGSVQSNTVTR